MIEFKPVEKKDLPELPEDWEWVSDTRGQWALAHENFGATWVDSNGDLATDEDCLGMPRQVIKALYVANGVEL
jgi:hypothetical protein